MDEPIQVLVVDDEKIIRSSLEYFLEDEGFEVHTAESGDEAFAILADNPIVIGIFDMRMPDMDGNTLIMKINDIYPHMKFIIYTGSTDYSLPIALTDIGITMDDVFIKPLADLSFLVHAINRLLGVNQ